MREQPIISLLTMLLSAFACAAQSGNPRRQPVPTSATIEIALVAAPGITAYESHWQAAYEIGIASDAAIWDAHKRTESANLQVGEIIKQGSFNESLRKPAHRRVVLKFSFSPEIQARLKDQSPGSANPNMTTAQSRELETRRQNLMFRSVVEIYDGKLKKNIIVPISTSRSLFNFPGDPLQITIQIGAAGDYIWNSSRTKGRGSKEIIKNRD
jgi:hypothetical protein